MKKKLEKKSIRDNYSHGELTKEILKGMVMGGLIIASFALPNLPQIFSLFGVKTSRERYRLKRAIQNLEKQNFVDIYIKNGEEVMKITEKGKKRILKYQLEDMQIIRPKKWDGSWRLVLFDIPEKYKRRRDAFAYKLKELEFYPIQKSAFLCPFECKGEIDFISEFFGIRKFIHYYIVKKLDTKDENYLKRYYNLS
jgi:DNA-binding transcriptional regulator PaaX